MGIHDPDALCHFSGITHCPWCGKEGQNEGTVVDHLQTVHYRLGLVYNRCHDCPSIMSDTLCQQCQQDCCQPQGKNPNKSASIWVIIRRNKTTSAGNPNKEVKMEWSTLGCPTGNTPTHCYSPEGGPADKASPANLHIPSLILPLNWAEQPPTFFVIHKIRFTIVNNVKS